MNDSKDKSFYITEISRACTTRNGNELLKLMDICNSNNLQALTTEQVKNYYEQYILKNKKGDTDND